MKKRIWNQLKKAVMVTVMTGIMGNFMVSAAEFDTQEEQKVLLRQSAAWTDEKNFQAEVCLELSGLKALYREKKTDENVNGEQKNAQQGEQQEPIDENNKEAEPGTETYDFYLDENGEPVEMGQISEDSYSEMDIPSEENIQLEETGDSEEAGGSEGIDSSEEGQSKNEGQLEEDRYFLTTYISEYFQVDEAGLKHDMQAESVKIQNQKGQETEITKLTCEVLLKDTESDTFGLKIPVSLRNEYRISPVSVNYPVCQDELLQKDQSQEVPGTYFWKKTGEATQVLAVTPSVSLQVSEAKIAITADLQQEMTEVRAGQKMSYTLTVRNAGELPLENMEVISSFSMAEAEAAWEQEDGFTVNGTKGLISVLQPGETRKLHMNLQLTESQSGELIHTVTLKAKHPGKDEEIGCQTTAKVTVKELKASFEVEKTADRTLAYPGDTITYQICIRNTGERTLHSVLSTERFQNAGILAKFVPKEGVTLNNNETQALIPQIAPGEAFALYATVTIPQYFTSQELVNEVTVISDETGTQTMRSQSSVTLTENETAAMTVTPEPTPTAVQTYSAGYASKSANAYPAASKPRTGDETETALYIVLGIFAVMSGISAFYYLRTQKRH